MSSSSLRILALEPYFGGLRKQVLQCMMQHSHHEWTLLKLPARRVERRLAAASRWFAEIIQRDHLDQDCDLLFTGEMLNVAELLRAVPRLSRCASVVYFQDNQLPAEAKDDRDSQLDFVNINNAMGATEIWFNSQWHLDTFLERAAALIQRQPDLAGANPISELRAKSQVVLPPTDLLRCGKVLEKNPDLKKEPRSLLVDTRNTSIPLLVKCLQLLIQRDKTMTFFIVGSQRGIPESIPRVAVDGRDEAAQLQALHRSMVYLSLRYGSTTDELLLSSIASDCYPVVPDAGIFAEMLPQSLHLGCLHDGTPDSIVGRILDGWYLERPVGHEDETREILAQVESIRACRVIDGLLDEVAVGQALRTA
jgi:hypothetical protein